jgi:hypothetical protein
MRAGSPGGARRWLAAAVLALGGLVGAWLIWAFAAGVLGYVPPVRGAAPDGEMALGWPWHGSVHLHTLSSGDASGTVGEITAAARRLGLDFVVLSDHTRAGRSEEPRRPRWIDDVLVIFAEEASLDEGHLLALNTAGHRYAIGPTARQAVRDVRELGGSSFVAHPTGAATPWRGSLATVDGFEIPNVAAALERLRKGPRGALARAAMAYPASSAASLLQVLAEVPSSIATWDRLTASAALPWPRTMSIIGAADAHGPRALGMPAYEQAMDAVTMTVWLARAPDAATVRPREAATLVADALATGRSAVVLSAAGRAPGFEFSARPATAVAGDSQFGPGDLIPAGDEEIEFSAGLGADGPYRIELVRDGVAIASRDGGALSYSTAQPGTYRVRVYRSDGPAGAGREGATPWILSNPIYAWPRRQIAMARRFAVPPLPGPPVSASLLAQPGWAAESDTQSLSAMAPLAAGLRWRFQVPRVEELDIHAALAWRPENGADWSEFDGLSLRIASGTERRIALHLWTRDASGATTTWEHVIAVREPEASTGVIWPLFRRLGAADQGVVPGTLTDDDLGAVLGVALLATPYIMRPGTDSSVDVLDFGLFGGPVGPESPAAEELPEDAR